MEGEGSYSGCRSKSGRSKFGGGIHERDPSNCYCGIPWIARTSNTDANPGRRFRRCRISRDHGGCKFFKWMDESCGNCREFIPCLLRKINNLEDQLALYEANEYVGAKEHLRKGPGCDCDHNWVLRN